MAKPNDSEKRLIERIRTVYGTEIVPNTAPPPANNRVRIGWREATLIVMTSELVFAIGNLA